MSSKLTRRTFLGLSLSASAAAVLASCAPAQPTAIPTEAPKATEVPKATEAPKQAPATAQEIHYLCRSDVKSAGAMDKQVEKWNSLMEAKVTMDEPSGDVVEKLSAAIAANDLVWDGYSMVENFNFKQWVQRGLMVPVEELTAASKIPNADKVLPAVIEPMKESIRVSSSCLACFPSDSSSICRSHSFTFRSRSSIAFRSPSSSAARACGRRRSKN